jgi:dihydrofolate reductase
MRRIRYQVAMSLDGFIARPDGGYDWIPMDPEIDFAALFAQFDTALLGRRTYEVMAQSVGMEMLAGVQTIVFSTTMKDLNVPGVRLVSDGWQEEIQALRSAPGKDIWLFGGGELFKCLAAAKLVDTIEVAVIPIVLGSGIPMAPPPMPTEKLKLTKHRVYRQSGIALLEYDLVR